MYKVAAYITAYEDKEALSQTITAIQKQSHLISEIFIVDNSKKAIVETQKFQNIIVEPHPENIGVDGGLIIAIKWAIAKQYDFLWLFDQDSQPTVDCLEILLNKYQQLSVQNHHIGIISPQIIDINTSQELPGYVFQDYKFIPKNGHAQAKDYYTCNGVITSGSLVNLDAAKNVPLPKGDLFLDAVDYSYCMNFISQGYEVVLVKNVAMQHRLGHYSEVKDRFYKIKDKLKNQLNNPVFTFTCSPSRYYYACRNHTYFETRNSNKQMLPFCLFYRLKCLIDMIIRIIRYEPDSVLIKVGACILGTFDGFRGRLGKTW
ncbi:glycosyl transferase family protein [Calothrix parasitica NIES-267]|uniref:Glycosyl transferase family protein n=1 Tax=Calothrix parasitica NIES-267 TaxID=1973488 RepID=A0A1Z4LIF2_9CYAN|nr:glycosyl transferase family protein [Calothrix parasitica NIES-267]